MKQIRTYEKSSTLCTCSDFSKSRIKIVYDLIYDYLTELSVEDEDALCNLQMKIDKEKIAMPTEIYEKFQWFIEEHLEPFVYNPEEAFGAFHSEENGCFDEDGVFHIKEGRVIVSVLEFMDAICKKQKALERFAMDELYPILVS